MWYAGGINVMKATGIVRRIDDLGRVGDPKGDTKDIALAGRNTFRDIYRP